MQYSDKNIPKVRLRKYKSVYFRREQACKLITNEERPVVELSGTRRMLCLLELQEHMHGDVR